MRTVNRLRCWLAKALWPKNQKLHTGVLLHPSLKGGGVALSTNKVGLDFQGPYLWVDVMDGSYCLDVSHDATVLLTHQYGTSRICVGGQDSRCVTPKE